MPLRRGDGDVARTDRTTRAEAVEATWVATLALVACGGDDGSTASALDATGRAQALDACASCANRVNNTFDRLLSTAAGTPSMRRRPHRAAVVRWSYGRDAADVAFISNYGPLETMEMTVWGRPCSDALSAASWRLRSAGASPAPTDHHCVAGPDPYLPES